MAVSGSGCSFKGTSQRSFNWPVFFRAPHFTPQHWILCHMGLYLFEFEVSCQMVIGVISRCHLRGGTRRGWPIFLVSIRTYQSIWHFNSALISSFCGAWVSASCGSPPRHHSFRCQLHRTPRRIKCVSPLTERWCRFTGALSTHQASET